MSEAADIATRTQRFNDAVRAFTPPSPSRHAKLMPVKDGVVELRQKGASLRLIRELLSTVGVMVGTDTIGRFLAELEGDQPPQRSAKRSGRRRAVSPPIPPRSVSTPQAVQPARTDESTERPRTRGPRIADPRNL